MTEEKIAKFAERIKEINGDNLVSIIFYQNNRLLAIFNELNLNNLEENSALVRKMEKKDIIPLYLTVDYIRTSCDVYPLEYIQMKNRYDLLYGKDVLAEIEVPLGNLRLESEQKIKGVLIRLTQVVLEQGTGKAGLRKTCFLALEDLVAGLKGLLEIAGKKVSPEPLNIIKTAQEVLRLDLSSVERVYRWKNGDKPAQYRQLVYDFYEKIEELADYADKVELNR